jgi:uncharacterized protein
MILKLLLIVAVIYIVYIMFFKQRSVERSAPKSKRKKEQKTEVNDMVECANCGLYLEVSEAILSNGKYYCSNECIMEAKN